MLQNELAVVARADKHWKEHSRGLIGLFDSQEMQLQKWGLRSMLPHFRMQVSSYRATSLYRSCLIQC